MLNSTLFLRDIKSSKRSVNITISTEELNVNIDELHPPEIQTADNKHESMTLVSFQSTLTTD